MQETLGQLQKSAIIDPMKEKGPGVPYSNERIDSNLNVENEMRELEADLDAAQIRFNEFLNNLEGQRETARALDEKAQKAFGETYDEIEKTGRINFSAHKTEILRKIQIVSERLRKNS